MLKHIQNLDVILADLERAGITILGAKSQFYCAGIKIMGYIYNFEGRPLDL